MGVRWPGWGGDAVLGPVLGGGFGVGEFLAAATVAVLFDEGAGFGEFGWGVHAGEAG